MTHFISKGLFKQILSQNMTWLLNNYHYLKHYYQITDKDYMGEEQERSFNLKLPDHLLVQRYFHCSAIQLREGSALDSSQQQRPCWAPWTMLFTTWICPMVAITIVDELGSRVNQLSVMHRCYIPFDMAAPYYHSDPTPPPFVSLIHVESRLLRSNCE